MQRKEYKLPNGKTAVFEYDVCEIGKVTLECMDELMSMIADRPQGMMEMARAIKKQCMRYPTYSDCHRCECFDKFEGECKLGEPAGWPIDAEEGEE